MASSKNFSGKGKNAGPFNNVASSSNPSEALVEVFEKVPSQNDPMVEPHFAFPPLSKSSKHESHPANPPPSKGSKHKETKI